MANKLNIFLLEDSDEDAELIKQELHKAKIAHRLKRIKTREELHESLSRSLPDAVFSDFNMLQIKATEALQIMKEKGVEAPFILITGAIADEIAVECLKEGMDDYILKSSLIRLPSALLNAIQKKRIEKENRRAQEALRRSEELYRLIAENTKDLVCMVDINGVFIYASPSYKKVLGIAPEELIGKESAFLIHPDDKERVLKTYQKALSSGKEEKVEYRFAAGEASERVFESVGSWIFDENSRPQKGVFICREITERKTAEDRIRQQAALLNITHDAIFVRDLEDRVLFWNKGAERVYGWTAEEAVGKKTSDLFDEDPDETLEAFKSVLEKGEWSGDLHYAKKTGDQIIAQSRWTLVRDERNCPASMLIVNTDITEKRKLESQFLHAQRMESLGALASGIAHDLNNVLSPILMSIEILKTRYSDERAKLLLATIETTARRGADLVKQVLSFGRGFEEMQEDLQAKYVIGEITRIVQETFPKSIQTTARVTKDLWNISVDPAQLHQILMNLCVNARDAMPGGGFLHIEAANFRIDDNYALMKDGVKPGPYIVLTVSDTGTGIQSEIIDKIFDPFFTTKTPGKGTGLGLSTLVGIVNNRGGFVNVASEIGRGTKFSIYLPAVETVETMLAERTPPEILPGQGKLILVVDDEASIREIIKATLEARDYKVMAASEGAEAVAMYVENQDSVELVITDMMMPVMDGPATARALKRLCPTLKIIAIGGLLSEKASEMKSLGIFDFLAKPFTAEDLYQIIQKTLFNS